jgi:ribonuclease HI
MTLLSTHFTRIGGRNVFAPPLCALVQTDGSYKKNVGRAGAILRTADLQNIHMRTWDLGSVWSSTEAEYASIFHGLQLALEKDQEFVCIENDCLPVIGSLFFKNNPLKLSYARKYRSDILQLCAQAGWVGLRWIPRELNKADALLR